MPVNKDVLSKALQLKDNSVSQFSAAEKPIVEKYMGMGYDVTKDASGKLQFAKKGTPSISAINPVSTQVVGDRIPLPDYKNPESRLNYAKAFTEKYGALMQKRGDTPLRINEVPAWGSGTSKNLAIKTANQFNIDPAVLYASAMEEGMSGLFPHKIKGRETEGDLVNSSGNKDYPVSGFLSFGLDTFADAYPGLVKKGYLPAGFDTKFKIEQQTNEKGESVNSANFKTADDALLAKAAMMKDSRDSLGSFIEKNNIRLSPKGQKFFELVAYNAGLGNAQEMLKSYNQAGYLKNDDYLKKRPSDSWQQPYENVIRRLQMADALKKEGYFDELNQDDNAMTTALKKSPPTK